MLIIDGVKYEEWVPQGPQAEEEFEQIVKEHAQDIFGEQSLYLDMKQKLKSDLGTSSVPDGFVIFFGDSRHWRIVEVELSWHQLHDHIVSQVGRFISGIENLNTQIKIVDAVDNKLAKDDLRRLRLKKAIEPVEVYKFLLNLISKPPILTVIIEKETPGLKEALRILNYPQIQVVEFRTFTKEGAGLSVHAHLFEPLYEGKKEEERYRRRGVGKTYPLSTSELLAKYGDRLSNVEGMTWQQLYDSNDDGNFRYFKVRIPLIELDKKETQQDEVI